MTCTPPSSDKEFLIEWICQICCNKAKDSLKLEYELLPGDKVILTDSNGDSWLFCMGCKYQYHLKCVRNLPRDITPEELGSEYYREDCGWFVEGAYDSE